MAHAAIQETEPCGKAAQHGIKVPDDGAERTAPNGRLAVLVNGKWAGYLYDETGGSGGRGSKSIVLFEVEQVGSALRITCAGDCDSKNKKVLGKQIHHEHVIKFFDGRTTAGERCQLFTL